MKVLIIGCDQLGAELAHRLGEHGHGVVIVDRNQSSFRKLHHDFKGRVHEGDALNREVLLRAGIEDTDVFIALSDVDSRNYVLGMAARDIFNVSQVIVRSNDPECQVVCQHMGLQAVSSAIWGAEQLEEMIYQGELKPVLTLGGGEIEIYSVRVPQPWENRSLDLLISEKENQVVASVTRSGKSMIPSGTYILKEDDILHVAADHPGIEDLRRKLQTGPEGGV